MKNSRPQSFVPPIRGRGLRAATIIAEYFGLTIDELRVRSKRPDLVTARFLCCYILNRKIGMPAGEVAKLIRRSRATVQYASKAYSEWMDVSQDANKVFRECQKLVANVLNTTPILKPEVADKPKRKRGRIKCVMNDKPNVQGSDVSDKLATYCSDEPGKVYRYKYNNRYITFTLPARLDGPDFFGAWLQWLEHRKELRKPLTQGSIDAQLKKLNKEGAAIAIECIEQSIEQGWQGLFPDSLGSQKKGQSHAKHQSNNREYNNKTKANYSGTVKQRATEELGEVF